MASSLPVASYLTPDRSARLERRAKRDLDQARVGFAVETARGQMKAAAIGSIARSALCAQHDVATVEGALVARSPTPHFEAQAHAISDESAMQLIGVVLDTGRTLR